MSSLIVHHHIDSTYLGRITGWAFAAGSEASAAPLIIEAWHADTCLGRAVANHPRPDVGDAYPAFGHSRLCGFDLEFRLPSADTDRADIRFQASIPAAGGAGQPQVIGTARQLTRGGFEAAVSGVNTDDLTAPSLPFPHQLVAIVARLWPSGGADLSDEFQIEMVDRIIALARSPQCSQIVCLMPYLRFLRAVWAHFQFVARYFPNINLSASLGSKDAYSKQNTSEEMLSIAHHLYVLKSLGLTGDFAEFGCFKGFSSSMLSYACHLLGIRMHIFDSFEGLPSSDSRYYRAGDFRGELDEVQRNIGTFGAPDAVTYHKGFFSDSLPVSNIPRLISLWMDVDLASSAADVMTVADRIDPRGTIFSHECEAGNFVDGQIVGHPGSVIPSIIDRFSKLGTPVAGRFLTGNTGALWRREGGVPVLSTSALMALVRST